MSEYTEQCTLLEWCAWASGEIPELDLLYAIPNGEKREKRTGARLKRMGVKAGVPDLFWPVARRGKHGLYLELKADATRKPTPAQIEMGRRLIQQGYTVMVAYGWEQAAAFLLDYYGCPTATIDRLTRGVE